MSYKNTYRIWLNETEKRRKKMIIGSPYFPVFSPIEFIFVADVRKHKTSKTRVL